MPDQRGEVADGLTQRVSHSEPQGASDAIPNVQADLPVKATKTSTALRLVLDTSPELFVGLSGIPMIVVGSTSNGEPLCLHSKRIRDWVALQFWKATEDTLRELEIDQILRVLAGLAWNELRNPPSIEVAMDEDPLVEAVLVFIGRQSRFDGTATALLKELGSVANRLGTDVRSPLWPKCPGRLSFRLQQLRGILSVAGLSIEAGRKSGRERFMTIAELDCDDKGSSLASGRSSLANTQHDSELHAGRNGDEARQSLFESLRAKRGPDA